MTGSRVLVVDDEPGLVRALAINLRAHGWEVATGTDGAQALDLAASWHPDVVLLDLGLPDIPGLDVIAGIRGWSRVPIVVLSARQHGEDKVDALDAGADDYVTKPFAMNELLARLRAAVRRAAPGDATEAVVVAGELEIDLARRRVLRAGAEVRLSPTEWAIVEVLVRNRGRLVSREQLLREVWGPAYTSETGYLRVYTAQLRRKLEADPSNPRHLRTQPGMGYVFEV
ncbi:response regulator [Cellulomonas chengniuliangii]|uniref:Response regulator transcription factor n=1 Tax=Cellulomonas chengniuliangii TaxID=2968084 RepID=A0ABY5KW10_9CELL|nr:response regulator transcription factor [Cellulomonas chengniuliangii]MCC2309971.1 response regulator transcription factor [Cellulomonas chengniuliangii]UUI74629.1 response regulator transcription factor [Cellulomonas chengniuliangii]